MSSSSRCCDGRTGEKICRAKYLIPLIILIVAVQLTIWRFLIGPRFFGYGNDSLEFEHEEKSEFGFSDKNYAETEDPDEDQNEIYNDSEYYSSSTVMSLREESGISTVDPATSTELQMLSSVGNYEQKSLEKSRHRHRLRKKKKYYINRKPPGEHHVESSTTITPATVPPTFPTKIHHHSTVTTTQKPVFENPSNKHHLHFQKLNQEQELRRQQEMERRRKEEEKEQERLRILQEEREKLRLTADQELRAQKIYEQQQAELKRRKEEEERRRIHEESGNRKIHTSGDSERKIHEESRNRKIHTSSDSESRKIHISDDAERRRLHEESERRRLHAHDDAERRRLHEESQRKLQEETERRRLHEESERRRLHAPDDVERRRLHEESQRKLQEETERRRLHEESERRRLHEEEQRRRLEHERKLKQWKEEDRRQNPASTQSAPGRESNQWHHPDVVDPWAHLRQLHEQRGIVAPSSEVPKHHHVETNEVDPFQITKHELEEVIPVWSTHGGHDKDQDRKNEEQARRLHQQKLDEARRVQQEEESRRKHLEENRRLQESRKNHVQQHHHHSVQGALEPMKNVNFGHHSHHRHHHVEVPPEVSNEVQPTVGKEERDLAPVIVTALIDIGRGDWHRFTRPFDLYLSYLLDLLKLQNRIIIYGDKSVVEFLQSQGESIDPSRLQIIEISLQDLPYYRYREEIEGIMKNEQENWQDSWEKATKSHPEATNPDYNILVNSKSYLMYNATQISKFESEFFVWLDAGYSHGQKNMIPHILWNPQLTAGKITAIKLTGEQDKIKNYNIDHVYRKQWTVLSGGVLAGDVPTIDRFRRFYHKVFMDLLDSKKTDDDQTTLLLTVANYHNLFHILTGGWFDAFKLLQNQ